MATLTRSQITCPACGVGVLSTERMEPDTGMVRCACGHEVFAGFIAEASYLEQREEWLHDRIEAGDGPPDTDVIQQYQVWDPRSPTTPIATGAGEPRPRGVGVQTVLLGLGALLLVVAASVFTAVAWERIGPTGQLLVVVTATLGVSAAAVLLRRRLHGTAEALAALGFGLVVVDLVAAPTLGVVPDSFTEVTSPYASTALTLLAVAALAAGHLAGLRSWVWLGWASVTAAAGAGAAMLAERAGGGASAIVLSLTLTAVVGVVLLTMTWVRQSLVRDRRPTVTAGAVAMLVAGPVAVGTTLDSAAVGAGTLFAVATTTVLLAALSQMSRPRPVAFLVAAGALVGASAALLLALALPSAPLALAICAGVAGAVALVLPMHRGRGAVGLVVALPLWLGWLGLLLSTSAAERLAEDRAVDATGALLVTVAVGLVAAAWAGRGSGAAAALAWAAAPVGFAGAAALVPEGYPELLEAWTVPLAVALLGAGWLASSGRTVSSLERVGPALTVALLPSAVMAWAAPWVQDGNDDPTAHLVRLVAVLVVGTVACIAGARRHSLGLFLPAAASLLVAAAAQLWTGLDALPRWMALGLAGVLLVVTGARFEWVRGEGSRARTWMHGLS